MKYEEYTSLIQKLELAAKQNPKGYESKVAWLARLGYAYFLGIVVVMMLIPLIAVAILIAKPSLALVLVKLGGKLLIIVAVGVLGAGAVLWEFVRALWSSVPPPDGIPIERAEAPELFATVDRISDFLKAPKPDHIHIIESFNAAVLTQPKFGVFGQRTYLLLGLPLMQAISPMQLEAVIAHELGHISERHSRTAASAYRVRATWSRFLESQEVDGHRLSFLYKSFLDWYFPYFNAYSFVLLRRQERDADAYAVELCGSRPLGEALIHLDVKSLNLSQSFWKQVLSEAAADKTPPREIFTRMARAFRETDRAVELQNLSKAVAVNTDYSDSHPSLGERLRAIGYWDGNDLPDLPEEVRESASARYIGELETSVSSQFNELWTERVRDDWRKRHEFLAETRKKLAELDEKAKTEELSDDEMIERAAGLTEIGEDDAAIETLRTLIERNPKHAEATFGVGMMLLDRDDDAGIEIAERAAALDRRYKAVVCERVHYYLRGKGRDEEARNYMIALESEEEAIDAANRERSQVLATDRFDVHKLTPEQVSSMRERIRYYDEVKTAFVVRKVVSHYDEEAPLNVLLVEMTKKPLFGGGARLKGADLSAALANRVGEFGVAYVVALENGFEALLPQLESIEGSVIYRAEQS